MMSDDQGAEMRAREHDEGIREVERMVHEWMDRERVYPGADGRVSSSGVLAVINRAREHCPKTGGGCAALLVFIREMGKALRVREEDNDTLRTTIGKLGECVVCALFSIDEEYTEDRASPDVTRKACIGFMIDVLCATIRATEGNTSFEDV